MCWYICSFKLDFSTTHDGTKINYHLVNMTWQNCTNWGLTFLDFPKIEIISKIRYSVVAFIKLFTNSVLTHNKNKMTLVRAANEENVVTKSFFGERG